MHEFKNKCRKLGFETEIVFKGIDKPIFCETLKELKRKRLNQVKRYESLSDNYVPREVINVMLKHAERSAFTHGETIEKIESIVSTLSNPNAVNELIHELLQIPDFKGCEIKCVGGLINVIVKSK